MAESYQKYSRENPPSIEFVRNNQGNHDMRRHNNFFQTKGLMGKETSNDRCSASRCYASISVKTGTIDDKTQFFQPIEIIQMNFVIKRVVYKKLKKILKQNHLFIKIWIKFYLILWSLHNNIIK